VERNAGLPPERRIEFRIGIHLGDVVEESDGDLMGDGINVAARLEGIADPGGICLSEDAYRKYETGSRNSSPISARKTSRTSLVQCGLLLSTQGRLQPPRCLPQHQTILVHRASPSLSCLSRISAAILSRSISLMG